MAQSDERKLAGWMIEVGEILAGLNRDSGVPPVFLDLTQIPFGDMVVGEAVSSFAMGGRGTSEAAVTPEAEAIIRTLHHIASSPAVITAAHAAQFEQLISLPEAATKVVAHALDTFGSVRKALHWLRSPCGALKGRVPVELLAAGGNTTVDEELSRIDYGIYV